MGANSKIEWTTHTWNPLIAYHQLDPGAPEKRGWFCIHAGDDCKGCYAEQWNMFRGNGLAYIAPNLARVRFALDDKLLYKPLQWASGFVFLTSMTDLFFERKRPGMGDEDCVPYAMLDR